MTDSAASVRVAPDDGWPQIWPLFGELVADESYAFPLDLTPDSARPWWMEAPPGRTVVAVDADGAILGSAKMGPNRPGRGSHVATASFMVDPAHTGRGVGRLLGEHVITWATEAGYHAMQFNAVVETNTAAVGLWQKLGFQILATVPEAFDSARHGRVGLHVMYRDLHD